MFGVNDIPKFFLAFFLVLPVISFVHEAGHVFFAWLMGGKNIQVTVGSGKVLFRFGMLEVRQYYFWYGLCSFDNLKRNHQFANILIFSGGVVFNTLSTIIVIWLVEEKMLEEGLITYQFTYFSMYYIFFALLPMPYPDGSYSDGKIILDIIRRKPHTIESVYRVNWDEEKEQWFVLDHDKNIVQTFSDEQEALAKAHEVARANRPSRLLNSRSGEEREIGNYPRVPL